MKLFLNGRSDKLKEISSHLHLFSFEIIKSVIKFFITKQSIIYKNLKQKNCNNFKSRNKYRCIQV